MMWIRYKRPDWSDWVSIRVTAGEYNKTVSALVAQGYIVEG